MRLPTTNTLVANTGDMRLELLLTKGALVLNPTISTDTKLQNNCMYNYTYCKRIGCRDTRGTAGSPRTRAWHSRRQGYSGHYCKPPQLETTNKISF